MNIWSWTAGALLLLATVGCKSGPPPPPFGGLSAERTPWGTELVHLSMADRELRVCADPAVRRWSLRPGTEEGALDLEWIDADGGPRQQRVLVRPGGLLTDGGAAGWLGEIFLVLEGGGKLTPVRDLEQYLSGSAAYMGLAFNAGTVLAVIEGSPAAEAGVRPEDELAAIQLDAGPPVPVKDRLELARALYGARPGQTVRLTVRREGEELVLTLRLSRRPAASWGRVDA